MRSTLALPVLAAALAVVPQAPAASLDARTVRASSTPAGAAADGPTVGLALAATGRIAALTTAATDLGPLDGNGPVLDVVTVDYATGARRIVSLTALGAPADGPSGTPALDRDGDVIAFTSAATNLVAGDTGGLQDVFVVRGAAAPVRVSVGIGGAEADGPSREPVLSDDGRFVAFTSDASNLVPGDTNGVADVFLRDLARGVTERLSVSAAGEGDGPSDTPAISGNGRVVSFTSDATALVPDDGNRAADVFVRDLVRDETSRVSISSTGRQQERSFAAPFRQVSDLSTTGRFVAFDSPSARLTPLDANRRADVFVRDRERDTTRLVSVGNRNAQGNNDSVTPTISGDGRYVAFQSFASNLAGGGTLREDLYLRDRRLGLTTIIDVPAAGGRRGFELQRQILQRPTISDDGQLGGFISTAANVVPPDANRLADAHLRLMIAPRTRLITARTRSREPRVAVGADDPGATSFSCRVDNGMPYPCRRGTIVLRGLKPGRHRLSVRAGGPGMLFDPTPLVVGVVVTR